MTQVCATEREGAREGMQRRPPNDPGASDGVTEHEPYSTPAEPRVPVEIPHALLREIMRLADETDTSLESMLQRLLTRGIEAWHADRQAGRLADWR